ncbi:MAG TPA: threonine/serine exporter family protein, partial [Thermoleophilia bacterium]
MTIEDPRMEFLSAMAAALSRYGETADSLESGLQACARTLGVEVAFFSVPTAVFAAYGHGAAMHTVLLHTRDSAIDLQALGQLDETLLDVTRGRRSAAQGLAEVRLITASPLRFPWYMRVLASGMGAAAISVFLGGGLRELTAAIPVG